MIGLAGAYASTKTSYANDENAYAYNSLFIANPIVGMDVYGFLTRKVFYRVAAKFSVSPFNNYSYSYFSFKPYVEYHLTNKVGFGVRLDYLNLSIKDVAQRKFEGQFNTSLPILSLVGVVRLFKN